MPAFSLTEKQRELRKQLGGSAKHHLAYGGSRSGKTFAFCYAIATRAILAPGSRHVIFRRHGVAVKQSVGKDTFPKMMKLVYPAAKYRWYEQDGCFAFSNGSEVWLAGLDDKDRVDKVLGKEFSTLYFNEASEIPLSSYLVAQTRLAQQVDKVINGKVAAGLARKCYVDLNPTTRAHWTYRMWVDGVNPDGETNLDLDDYDLIVMNPMDNLENLSTDYIAALEALPERQRRRFLAGEYTADVESALWRRSYFHRVKELPDLQRIVVAIDPAVSSDVGSDETGIIVAGVDKGGIAYVIEDESGKYRPEEWARRAISLYDEYSADRVVAEVNQGGDMVENVIRAQRADVPYTAVRASRGKVARAEPVAALYERGKVFHVGEFIDLESQMCSVTSGFDSKAHGWSPDRVDALVWAITELFPRMTRRTASHPPIRRQLGTMA